MPDKKDAPLVLGRDSDVEIVQGRSLHRKLAQIMYEAERIPKRGRAPAVMGGYPFVQVGDAADYIRKALGSALITMLPTKVTVVGQVDRPTAKGGTMTTVDLVTEWTLTDGESGEAITFESFGAGADGGDKYSGKASTSTMKYALLTAFLLSTGDDTEQTDTSSVRHGDAGGTDTGPAAPARAPEPNVETEELVGDLKPPRTGIVKAGGGAGYKLEARQGPDGHVIGFALETARGNIPQVVADGALGEALYLATGMNPARLIGEKVTLRGRLYQVKRPGTRGYHRLHLTGIETADYILPADALDIAAGHSYSAEPVLPEPPEDVVLASEAPTAPLFDDVA